MTRSQFNKSSQEIDFMRFPLPYAKEELIAFISPKAKCLSKLPLLRFCGVVGSLRFSNLKLIITNFSKDKGNTSNPYIRRYKRIFRILDLNHLLFCIIQGTCY